MNWTNKLQQGDKVIITYNSAEKEIRRVERTTKTLIIAGRQRFNKDTLRVPGQGYYSSPKLKQYTEQAGAEITAQLAWKEILEKVAHVDFSAFTTSELEQINELIEDLIGTHENQN
jgi:hypothetical protein